MRIENGKIYVKYWDDEYVFTYRENEKLKVDIEEIRALSLKPDEKADILELILDNFYHIPIKSTATYMTYFIDKYTLDFTNCKDDVEKFYDVIESGFYFPPYFGRNMDAVWDCIRWEIDSEKPIEIIGINRLTDYNQILGERFLSLINDFMREYPECKITIIPK